MSGGRQLSMGGHERPNRGLSDEWLTPPTLIKALGEFDLDPCSPVDRPWDTARRHLTEEDDGLSVDWSGRVWLNPPYSQISTWMRRMAMHGNGTALVFARVETAWWWESVWPWSHAILFPKGRLRFLRRDGTSPGNAGAPSAFVAYSEEDAAALAASGIVGWMVSSTRGGRPCG